MKSCCVVKVSKKLSGMSDGDCKSSWIGGLQGLRPIHVIFEAAECKPLNFLVCDEKLTQNSR